MLNIMREKAGSWIIKALLIAIAVVFVFWGVGSFRQSQDSIVAEVNGTAISQEVYRKAYLRMLEQYRRMYGGMINDESLKMLRLNEQALDQLVNRLLMLQEAERLQMEVSAQEVKSAIQNIPAFQKNGAFDFEMYKAILNQNNIAAEEFENEQKENMLLDRLRALVSEGVTTTEAEARQWFDWSQAQINLSYLLFSPGRHDVTPSDDEVAEFFKKHENDYRTDPRVKARFLFFDPKAFESKVTITEENIAQYYNEHPEAFKSEKTVEARHILVKVDENAEESVVSEKKNKALEIYQRAREAKQSFAELANQYSEDSDGKDGGFLGAFTRESMVKPFADKAFAMQAGEISEPVRTQFGWHIIKVENVNEEKTQSLAEAGETIKATLLARKSRALALEKAEAVYDQIFDGDDLAKIGEGHQIPARGTEFFSLKTPPQDTIADAPKFAEVALGLEKLAVSPIQEMTDGYYLLQVTEREESQVPPLDQVAAQVRKDVIKARQDELAKADAQKCLDEVRAGKRLADAAAAFGLSVEETGFFARNETIPKIGAEQEISRAGFDLSAKKALADQVMSGQQGWYVISLKERRAPAEDGFEKEKKNIVSGLTEQKKQAVFQNWLAELKSRGKVEINRQLIQ